MARKFTSPSKNLNILLIDTPKVSDRKNRKQFLQVFENVVTNSIRELTYYEVVYLANHSAEHKYSQPMLKVTLCKYAEDITDLSADSKAYEI